MDNTAAAPLYNCPVEATMSRITGKYKAIILFYLITHSTARYSELQRYIPAATPRMLTRQLRELEADGLIHREVFPVVPPRTEYTLTELGETLTPIIRAVARWGREHMAGTYRVHSSDSK